MNLNSMIARDAYTSALVSSVREEAELMLKEITNIGTTVFIAYTKPVRINNPNGYLSLVHRIDKINNTSVPEIVILESEAGVLNAINSLASYTTEVRQVAIRKVSDTLPTNYGIRTSDALSRYIDLSITNPVDVLAAIIEECFSALDNYFAAVNYDVNRITMFYDKLNDVIPGQMVGRCLHEGNQYTFVDHEIIVLITTCRVSGNQFTYDYMVGLGLSALRSGKNDSVFMGVKL